MEAIKKINNNVAVCRDANGNELVAFGKGIGFPKMPYQITDLSKISMTFYQLNAHYYQLLSEIPQDVLDVSTEIVRIAQMQLPNYLNPNMVFSLADHIHFALTRLHKYKDMKLAFSYDIAQLYPKETEVARYAIKLIQRELLVTLPEAEVTSIALHLVNGQAEVETNETEVDVDALIDLISALVESRFSITLNKDGFSYNRFVMHLRYYLKRLQTEEQFIDHNEALLDTMRENMPYVYDCAIAIHNLIYQKLGVDTTEDELVYLIVHLNRIINTTNEGE